MTDPLKILGRLASKGWRRKGMWSMRNIGMGRTTFRLVDDPDYHALRTAIEAQAESGLEHVGWQQRYLCPDEGPSLWCSCNDNDAAVLSRRTDYEVRKVYAINETDRQSHAAVKAEALREAADLIEDQWDHQDAVNLLRDEADRIEREAKEES